MYNFTEYLKTAKARNRCVLPHSSLLLFYISSDFPVTHPLPVLLQYGSLPVHGFSPLPDSHHLIFSSDKELLYPLPVPDILTRIYPLLLPYLTTFLLNHLSFLRLPFCRQIRTFSHLLYSPQFHKASAEPAHPTH